MTSIMDPKFNSKGGAIKAPVAPKMDNNLMIAEPVKVNTIKPEAWAPLGNAIVNPEFVAAMLSVDPFLPIEELRKFTTACTHKNTLSVNPDLHDGNYLHCQGCGSYLGKPGAQDESTVKKSSSLDKQVAGSHYKSLAIQPVEYIHANKIGYFEGNVIKYVTRWREKAGLADLEKAKHYIELLIDLEARASSAHKGE